MVKSKIIIIAIISFIIVAVIALSLIVNSRRAENPTNDIPSAKTNNKTNMIIKSSAFADSEDIPVKYSCDGESINPPLSIDKVPQGTKSLALIMEDPDSPSGVWTHWTVWNIPPDTALIDENSVPDVAEQGLNTAGRKGYYPPCPASGKHRYYFKLYALDEILSISTISTAADLRKAMQGHLIDETDTFGRYQKK